jgi:Fuc2NAc and GlcNAc transferase
MLPFLVVLAVAPVATWALTATVRRYALARGVLDVPGARSSHARVTPRGGGLAIAAVVLGGVAVLAGTGALATPAATALLGGGALVALVGWVDDIRDLAPQLRALTHLLAGAWAVWWLGAPAAVTVAGVTLPLGLAGAVLAVLAVGWCINFYNFMDGIDGLAAGQAATTGVFAGVMLFAADGGLALVALLTAAAGVGFLVWNWQPARIFMGDVGSGLLGYIFACLALATHNAGTLPVGVWLLLLGVFVFDTTVTLVRRVARGEKWYAAHRKHAYQRVVQAGASHAQVTAGILALNGVLGALAVAGWWLPRLLDAAVLAGMVLLTVLYVVVERRMPMPRGAVTAPLQQ